MANEKLLIDLQNIDMNEVDTSDCTDVEDILSAVITYLSEQPIVDAVEVVRCKDCVDCVAGYCAAEINGVVRLRAVKPDDFCAWGRRKDNG